MKLKNLGLCTFFFGIGSKFLKMCFRRIVYLSFTFITIFSSYNLIESFYLPGDSACEASFKRTARSKVSSC